MKLLQITLRFYFSKIALYILDNRMLYIVEILDLLDSRNILGRYVVRVLQNASLIYIHSFNLSHSE